MTVNPDQKSKQRIDWKQSFYLLDSSASGIALKARVGYSDYMPSVLRFVIGGLLGIALLAWSPCYGEGTETYVVEAGDTLSGIAQQFDVRLRDLQRYNELTDPHRLRVGLELKIPPGPDVPLRYTVRPGDSLSIIAQAHGVTTQTLVDLNELDDPHQLRVGQILLIPGSARVRSALAPALQRELDRIRVRSGWTHIVIHHSGTARGNAQDMDRYHRDHRRMVNGLGYHFVIGNGQGMADGEIAIGPRWIAQQDGGHLASPAQNRYSIGICLVGNFDQTKPTARQMEQLRALVRYLQDRVGIPSSRVTTHTLINVRPTRCPGRHFPTEAFIRSL